METCLYVNMARTTIQLDDKTKKLLERVKAEMGVASYAEAIRLLVRQVKFLDKSERGTLPKLERFRRGKLDRFD